MKKIINLITNLFNGDYHGYLGKITDKVRFLKLIFISSKINRKKEIKKKLFIDLGANIGQAYELFSYFFDTYDFILIEPNNECIKHLEKLKIKKNSIKKIINKAASINDGHTDLYLNDMLLNHQGASIQEFHNKEMLSNNIVTKKVQTFNFVKFFIEHSKKYDSIILKIDIEGSEYTILEELIKLEAFKKIEYLFVEFHSYLYINNEKSQFYKQKEKKLINFFKKNNIGYLLL